MSKKNKDAFLFPTRSEIRRVVNLELFNEHETNEIYQSFLDDDYWAVGLTSFNAIRLRFNLPYNFNSDYWRNYYIERLSSNLSDENLIINIDVIKNLIFRNIAFVFSAMKISLR